MKRSNSEPATKADLIGLEERLEKKFEKKFATKQDLKDEIRASDIRTDIKLEELEQRIDDKARMYRDEVLTKMDFIIKELSAMRQEQTVTNHRLNGMQKILDTHKTRIQKLESVH